MPHGYQGRRSGPPKNDDGSAPIPRQFYDTMRKRIDEFKVGPTDRLVLEPMDSAQRKAVHDMANRLRVLSKSSGSGVNRHCVITRRAPASMQAASLCSESEPISLTHEQKVKIVAFIKDHPISDEAIDAHVTVSSEARDSVRESKKYVAPRAEPQIPPAGRPRADIARTRHELPAFHAREKVIAAIEKNKVSLITGGTGCGKTTQVPQFLLERALELGTPVRIICTQPRRLPAIAVAQRVAAERGEQVSGTVGYHIRLEQRVSQHTVLTYCTSGVLLRMLTQDELARDCTHIILDEVHEREQNTDYLLIALRQALKKRHDLKVILMSATMEGNLHMFMNYFKESNIIHVDIPSRLYPVTNFHLADVMALTGYTPPESVYGGGTISFNNGFGGFGGGGGGNSSGGGTNFAVGNWGGSGGGAKDTFASATTWNNSDAKIPAQQSNSYHNKPALTPSNSLVSQQFSTADAAAAGNVRSTQSAVYLPNYGNKSQGGTTDNAAFMDIAQKLASANSGANPLQQQGGGAYPSSSNHSGGMHRSATVSGSYTNQQQQQYGQQQYGNNMQQNQSSGNGRGGGGYYGQELSWDNSPSGYMNSSSDIVDLPMDEDDRNMTMQANQHLYGGGYGGQSTGYGSGQQMGFGPRGGGGMQQQSYQSGGNGYGSSYNQSQQQMYGGGQQQQYHQSNAAGGNHGMYQYHQYQSQPNMQLHQSQQQQPQWPQQQMQPTQPLPQPMFYVPDSSSNYFVNSGSMLNQPPASSYLHRSTSAAASLNDADQYGMGLREEENARNSMVAHIQNMLPNRPSVFCGEAVKALAAAGQLMDRDRKALTQFYRNAGGAQWEESVDVELALVTVRYLMDSDIPGSILVFLPGYEDIQALREKIQYERWPGVRPSLCLLHSQLNSSDQQRVFEQTKMGERKVILSTNIAEASLTIDDVVFVVDCGKAKEKTYDHASRISQLKCIWIAKSNAEQRRGRAGRCRAGYCFRLYSDEEFDAMLPSQIAEMQRSAIHDVCLHAKMFAPERMSVKEFLELAPEPPEAEAVDSSLQFLEQLGALYTEQQLPEEFSSGSSFYGGRMAKSREPELTQLGRLVAHLPLDPQLARLLLFGYALRCFNPIVTLVALLSHRDPFTLAVGDEKQAAQSARDSFAHRDFSDHLMILRAFAAYSACGNNGPAIARLCKDKYLSGNTLRMVHGIRRQLLMELRRIRFINEVDGALDDSYLNEYSNNWPMVQAAIVAGSYPCIGFVKGSKMRKIRTYTDSHSQLHPSSSLKRQMLSQEKRQEALQKYYMGEPTIEYLAFQEFVKIEEGLTLRTSTAIPSVTIFLFAGPIRLSRDKLQSYFVSTSEEALKDDPEGQEREYFQPRDILELESWLSVKGCIGDFIRMMQLRFKIMDYVLSVWRTPPMINNDENKMLLATLANVLDLEHKTKGFNEVNDVYFRPGQAPQQQSYGNNSYNQQNPLKKQSAPVDPARMAGYDFGAMTSSSSNSQRDEKMAGGGVKKPDLPKPFGNGGGASYKQHQPTYLQQHQQRSQQQKKEKESIVETLKELGRGGGEKSSAALNWRQQQQPAGSQRGSPTPSQQQQPKVYPDPYRPGQQQQQSTQQREQPAESSNAKTFKWPRNKGNERGNREEERANLREDEKRGNGYDRRGDGGGREEKRNFERQQDERGGGGNGGPKWNEKRGGNTVAARLAEKRGSRSSADDFGSNGGNNRFSARNQQRYEEEDDGGNDRVPEDPRVYDRDHQQPKEFHRDNRGYGSQRRPDDRRDYKKDYGNQDRKQHGAGPSRFQQAPPSQEEDWGKNANSPSFFSTEGGTPKESKKGGRTFVNSRFQSKGMHSDRMEGKSGGYEERDPNKPRGSRSARD